METRQAIASNVRAFMGAHQVSQTKLGEVLGCSQGSVSKRLTCEIAFDTDELFKLAEFFGTTPLRFLDTTSDLGVRPSGWTSGSLVPA